MDDYDNVIYLDRKKNKLNQKKVLVVEDEIDITIFLTTFLETNGYKSIVAKNGKEGEEKAISERPDLILLDLMIPKQGGIQLYRKIKLDKSLYRTPVVIISAISKKTFLHFQKMLDAHLGRPLPAPEGYIEKPAGADELLREIKKLL